MLVIVFQKVQTTYLVKHQTYDSERNQKNNETFSKQILLIEKLKQPFKGVLKFYETPWDISALDAFFKNVAARCPIA